MVGAMERVELTADLANVAVARQTVRRCLVGVDDQLIGDVELIVSELVTNAFNHGPAGAVIVEVDRDDDGVHAVVTSPAPPNELASPEAWTLPDADGPSGRGLAIVRRLADDVRVRTSDGQLTVAVTMSRPSN